MTDLRYVVLWHQQVDRPHYDLMLEREPGGKLVTWRLSHWPIEGPLGLTRLPDHRSEYLNHEGPVSGGRGYVERVEAGTYRLEEGTIDGDKLLIMLLPSNVWLELSRHGDSWVARPGRPTQGA